MSHRNSRPPGQRYKDRPNDLLFHVAGLEALIPTKELKSKIITSIKYKYKMPFRLDMGPPITVTLPPQCVRDLTNKASAASALLKFRRVWLTYTV